VISLDLLLGLLPVIRIYEKVFSLRWPINRESLLTIKKAPKKVDSSKARKALAHACRPLEESVRDLIEWNQRSTIS
jgi:dihydroflavonol-4-reductase